MYKKYEILKLLVSFCQFVNLQIVRTKTFIRKRRRSIIDIGYGSYFNSSPLNRYFSQITLTNRIYLYNIAVTPVERVMLFVLMYVGTSHNARYP
jgi:phage terminase large subunit-like protein